MDSLVSIICVTHGRRELVLRCLESCINQDYPNIKIIVLLNPADPETEKIIRDKLTDIKIIRSHRNLGIFPAINIAIANSNGEYIMVVDDDAYFLSNDVVSRMKNAFDKEPGLGAVTCNIEGPHENTLTGKDRYVDTYKTGFTMLPKKVFTDWIGYYPDIFFRSAGENYICTALWDKGYKTRCLVDARMFHDQTLKGRSDFAWKFYGLRSQILCVFMREPWYVIPFSVASKFIKSFVKFVLWGHVHTWFMAWFSIFIHIPESLSQRDPISWKTYILLRRLRNEYISNAGDL